MRNSLLAEYSHDGFRSFSILLGLAALLAMSAASAEPLTIERIFADPDLSGPGMRRLEVAPDGSRVTFLRAKDADRFRFDLWEYNLQAGESRLLVDSLLLAPGEEALSDEQKARRERQRISSHKGIVEYFFSADGSALLFPLGGDVYLYDLRRPPDEATRRLTNDSRAETDLKFSPYGSYVSFVREQNLYALELERGLLTQLSHDGAGLVRNGMAEFIAQEEMGRDTGYWWSPDEKYVAYTRTDESSVGEVERFEIYAEDFKVYRQRYPAAGTDNVRIRLGVTKIGSDNTTWIDLGRDEDIYLARVDWFPDGRHLLVQRQTRDQKRLDLLKADAVTGKSVLLFSEESDTWIDLHDNLHFLKDQEAFVWASARSGFPHLYLYRNDGRLIRPLTAGEWSVAGHGTGKALVAVDEDAGLVYFMATQASPTERQLYTTRLDTETPAEVTRVTREPGWHIVEPAANATIYVDLHSSIDTPPRVRVHRMDGTFVAWLQQNRLDESHPYHAFLDAHSEPTFGTLESEDGQALHYRMVRPRDFDPAHRYPVIVDVYGGPHGQKVKNVWSGYPRTTDGMWQQYLAQNGYIVFTLDNRGTSYRGTAFDAPIYQRLGQVEVRDQLVGVEYLRSLDYVDPGRIGVFGWSYGGYMALMCMMQAPEMFAAGVSGAPVTDWRLYDTHYTERYLGDPRRAAQAYQDASVFSYVEGLSGPVLIMHGMADDNVLFSNSTKLFKNLQTLGTPFDVMTYPGSKHGLLRHRDTGIHGYRSIKRHFDQHLGAALP